MIDHVRINTKAVASNGTGDDLKIYMDSDYQDLIHRYTLPMILRTFGRPTQVLVSVLPSTGAEPGVNSFFKLDLAYPDKGFYVNYFTFATAPENHYEGCPSFSFVSIWSEAPVPGLSNEDLITKMANWSPEFFLGFKNLEQVTDMTIDEFVQIFSQLDLHCIDTPKSAWPTQ